MTIDKDIDKTYEENDLTSRIGDYKLNENKTMTYSFPKGLGKGIVAFIVFAAPVFLTHFPEYVNLSIGAVLTILVNYLKLKYKSA